MDLSGWPCGMVRTGRSRDMRGALPVGRRLYESVFFAAIALTAVLSAGLGRPLPLNQGGARALTASNSDSSAISSFLEKRGYSYLSNSASSELSALGIRLDSELDSSALPSSSSTSSSSVGPAKSAKKKRNRAGKMEPTIAIGGVGFTATLGWHPPKSDAVHVWTVAEPFLVRVAQQLQMNRSSITATSGKGQFALRNYSHSRIIRDSLDALSSGVHGIPILTLPLLLFLSLSATEQHIYTSLLL